MSDGDDDDDDVNTYVGHTVGCLTTLSLYLFCAKQEEATSFHPKNLAVKICDHD